jgi:hypothetical protein
MQTEHQISDRLGRACLAIPVVALSGGQGIAARESVPRIHRDDMTESARGSCAVRKRAKWTAAWFEEITWAALAGSGLAALALGFWSAR